MKMSLRKYGWLLSLAALSLFMSLASCSASCDEGSTSIPKGSIVEVPFTHVHFSDAFWMPRIETNRTVTIPAALHQCDINGRFDNFAIAGGLLKGEHKGDFPFDDTDPYKVIEGASYSLAAHYDAPLDKRLDSLIGLIAAAQEPDGYLTTCVTNKCTRLERWWGKSRWEKINSHELYNCGHLYEAAVAHHLATGKRNFLEVAVKNADLICRVFGYGLNQISYPSGHPIIEMGLAKLYKVTGNRKYLDQALYFVRETGRLTNGRKPSMYSQDHMPILDQEEMVGHAVRAGYLYAGVADVAALTNDSTYFNALTRIWNNLVTKKLYITGGMGSRAQGEGFGPNYELHNHTAYCETCASIANVYWNYRMFLATGQAQYMDVLERALYNGVLSGVSLSGDRFFYDNPLESQGEHERQEWFGCACCPGNITRFMASVPGYVYATQGPDIYVNLYAQGTSEISTNNNQVAITQTTDYPWEGTIQLDIVPKLEQPFAIRLRIPGWAQNSPVPGDLYSFVDNPAPCKVRVNGKKVRTSLVNGYVVLDRTWRAGDVVTLELNMHVRRIKANEQVEDDLGKWALQRGPIVYALEGRDQADSTVFNKYIEPSSPLKAEFEAELLGGITVLRGMAVEVSADGRETKVPFTAIPYSVWNNRGPDEMEVWIPMQAEAVRPTPEPTVASEAEAYIDTGDETDPYAYGAWGVNDRWEPKRSSDTSKPYHYWWLRRGTKENIAYHFEKPVTVCGVDVYWLDFDQYDGNFRVPASWRVMYKNSNDPKNGPWREVEAQGPYTVTKDAYNSVSFVPVTATDIKLEVQLQAGESGGVLEWKLR